MFRSFGLKGKIVSLCVLLSSFVTLAGGIGWFAMKQVIYKYDHVAKVNLENAEHLGIMYAQFWRARSEIRTLGMTGVQVDTGRKALENMEDIFATYNKANEEYLSIPFVEGEDELYKPVGETWKKYVEAARVTMDTFRREGISSQPKLIEFFFKTAPALAKDFNASISKLMAFQQQEAEKWSKAAADTASWANAMMLIVILGGFAAALGIGLAFARSLTRLLSEIAQKLSAGADEVASAATEISATSETLSSATAEQASSLQETASSIEQMSAMVKKNADNAIKSNDASSQSRSAATKGKEAVSEMIGSIQAIDQANAEIMSEIEESNRQIGEIVRLIAEIGNKTKVINDIVFQTKLLSFNASVEAARAGEQGKGFSVVAEEVGNLAHMSGNAAKEISNMLESSIKKVEEIVSGTKTKVDRLVQLGKSKVAAGAEVARRCGDVLEEVVGSASSANDSVSEIAAASKEQAQGVQEITKAMTQLNQVTQQNAASSHQAASAATELTAQAESFRSAVQSLMQAVHGETRGGSDKTTKRERPKPHQKDSHKENSPKPTSVPSSEDKRFKLAA